MLRQCLYLDVTWVARVALTCERPVYLYMALMCLNIALMCLNIGLMCLNSGLC